MKCKFTKSCPLYKKILKKRDKEGMEMCNTNIAKSFYGFGRHAGCYRSMQEKDMKLPQNSGSNPDLLKREGSLKVEQEGE